MEPRAAADRDWAKRIGEQLLDLEALAAMPFRPDRMVVNGSSLAFLAEFMGRPTR